jgi:3-deoxy-D-manno-octulosonic-acid transferase
MLAAHASLRATFPNALLILVPRHPERFGEVAALIESSGMRYERRSSSAPVKPETAVWLGDSMGELMSYLSLAHVAFVGGSFVPTGGHNVLEPIALGVPVLTGPHDFNFAAINAELRAAGALKTVHDATALATTLNDLLSAPEARERQVQAGQAVLAANRGAVARQMALLTTLLAR